VSEAAAASAKVPARERIGSDGSAKVPARERIGSAEREGTGP